MKKKGNFRKVVSGLLAGMTMLSTVLSPMTAYAAEIQPEEKPPLYEEVKDLLDEDEVVTAKDYEIETGSVFNVKSDYTGLEIKDDNKVKVTFEEAKNDKNEDFTTDHADTYKAVYYVEPVNQEHPKYQISRKLIVREKETEVQTETEGSEAVTESETAGSEQQTEETENSEADSELLPTEEVTESEIEEFDSQASELLPEMEEDTENTTDSETGLTVSDAMEQAEEEGIDLYAMEAGETVTSGGVIPMGYLGAAGLFVAMICTILTVESYHWIKEGGWVIKMPDSVPPAVSRSFSSLIPAAIILTVVFLIKVIFEYTPYATVFDLIYQCLQQPLSALGNSLPSQMISEGLIGLFWCFGVHGDNVVSAIMGPIWRGLSAENLALVQAGKEPINIICQQFRDVYLIAGGTGATLSLLVSIWFGAKSPELKTVAKLSGPAAIFNINEPVIFGIPIVLNPIMMIPFVIVPIVLCVTTYLAMSLGLVPLLQGIEIPWTTPVFISGWIAGGWNALILQIVNFAVATAIYFPFVKVLDRDLLKNAKKKELLQE